NLSQIHSLNLIQRFALRQLMQLRQKLKDPSIPNPVRGLEGMLVAHELLQQRGACGVLIGGISEAIWNPKRKPGELYKHKDVDVIVLDDHFKLQEKFERGIDWWMPQSSKINIRDDVSRMYGVTQKWYENGHGIVLSFGVNNNLLSKPLSPGLYIPDSEWVIDMRICEAYANIDHGVIEVDEDTLDKYKDKLRNRIKESLPGFIKNNFEHYILSPHYEKDYDKVYAINLATLNLSTIRAIYARLQER
ncbi:MAG: hypothetical protein ACMXYC_03255, partial [Candidatus Woesearchaeota archaeon]